MQKLNTVDLKDIQSKLYERLKPSGWGDKLKGFLLSDDFYTILDALLTEAMENKRFTPTMKQLFKAFEECPYSSLKVVIVGQDPYPYPGVADGIAFSCGNDSKIQASLRYMFKDIEETVYKDGYKWDGDLTRWCNQGVLMLNTALTTNINKVGMHVEIWKPFIQYLLDIITFENPGLVYAFMGKKAQEWMKSVPDNNYKFACNHPAYAAHNNAERWDSGEIFVRINDAVNKQFGTKIIW